MIRVAPRGATVAQGDTTSVILLYLSIYFYSYIVLVILIGTQSITGQPMVGTQSITWLPIAGVQPITWLQIVGAQPITGLLIKGLNQ